MYTRITMIYISAHWILFIVIFRFWKTPYEGHNPERREGEIIFDMRNKIHSITPETVATLFFLIVDVYCQKQSSIHERK